MQRVCIAVLSVGLLLMPVIGCTSLKNLYTSACKQSEYFLGELESAKQRLEIIRSFLAVAVPSDLQVELNRLSINYTVTRADLDNSLALVQQVLSVLATLIEDACAGNTQQALQAAKALDTQPVVMGAIQMAKRTGHQL